MELLDDEAQVEARFGPLQVVLTLTQDRCTVCAEHIIGSKILLDAQDMCTVCTEHTISLKIILPALDETPR
jgi:hypothetical protein